MPNSPGKPCDPVHPTQFTCKQCLNLDKLDDFYLVSHSTAECLTCDANITTEDWGNIRDIVERCLAHECGIQYQEDSHTSVRKADELPAPQGANPFWRHT